MDGSIRFLSVDDVRAIHEDTIAHEGGQAGLRSPELLDAAVAMPRQQVGGRLLHETLPGMAAAYLYHIAQNHPFYDGNKRTGAMAALVFLDVNGVCELPEPEGLERMTMDVAASRATKQQLTDWMAGRVGGTP